MHILVVEDSPINRRFIGLALSKAGFEVTCAENGENGVAAALAGNFDAILMDVQMPIMNGLEAAEHLRESGLTTPIIALTGNATHEDRQRSRQAGFDDHLSKPIDPEQLITALNRVTDSRLPNASDDSRDFSPELRRITLDYLDTQRQRIDEMNLAVQNSDFQQLAELAHRMKGTAGTVGFPQFTEPAVLLEKAALSNNREECWAAMNAIEQLQQEADEAIDA